MPDNAESLQFLLDPEDNERLSNLCGPLEDHLRKIESRLGIEINNRGNSFRLLGEPGAIAAGREVLSHVLEELEGGQVRWDRGLAVGVQ